LTDTAQTPNITAPEPTRRLAANAVGVLWMIYEQVQSFR
jgi:hypothetical protein